MTIREIILKIQNEIGQRDLQYNEGANCLRELTSLLGNINDQIRVKDLAYNKVLLNALDTEGKANRAKIVAEISPEYQEKLEARNTKELVLEMIRGLKYWLRAKDDEWKESKTQ